jgi:nucleoside-diphosphate kinase
MSQLQRTFGIIKPDAVAKGCAGQILAAIEGSGFQVIGLKKIRLSTPQAEAFYAVHRERPFYRPLVSFMTEGPVIVMALERENAVAEWRALMGATDPKVAGKGTLRERFGTNIERNAVHGSDAPETAAVEIPFFFSSAELL